MLESCRVSCRVRAGAGNVGSKGPLGLEGVCPPDDEMGLG